MTVPAAELVMSMQKASTSMLQTKLKLGFSRASRVMDEFERYGVVGPQDPRNPAVPRQIYGPRQLVLGRRTTSMTRATDTRPPDPGGSTVPNVGWGILSPRWSSGWRGTRTTGTRPGAIRTGLLDDDTGPGPASRQSRARRGTPDHRGTRPGPARTPAGGPRAQGRRPVPRRARHEDPRPLPGRARARRLSRAAGERLHEGLPAQLRAVSRPGPGRRPAAVASRARRPARATGRHHRPAADRHAAQGPDLLAQPRRLRAADRGGPRVRGVSRRPAAALRQAAHDRGDDAGGRRDRGRRIGDRVRPARHVERRAPRSRSPHRGATRTASAPTPTATGARAWSCAAGATSSR